MANGCHLEPCDCGTLLLTVFRCTSVQADHILSALIKDLGGLVSGWGCKRLWDVRCAWGWMV